MNVAAALNEIAAFMAVHPDVHLSMVNPVIQTTTFRADTIRDFDVTRDAIQGWFHLGRPSYRDHDDYEIATWQTHIGSVWLYGSKNMPMTED